MTYKEAIKKAMADAGFMKLYDSLFRACRDEYENGCIRFYFEGMYCECFYTEFIPDFSNGETCEPYVTGGRHDGRTSLRIVKKGLAYCIPQEHRIKL